MENLFLGSIFNQGSNFILGSILRLNWAQNLLTFIKVANQYHLCIIYIDLNYL